SITLSNIDVDAETLRLVPAPIARKYEVLPVKRIGGTLTLAMADPTNVFALDDVAFMTSLQILPVVAPQAAIRKAIEKHYEAGQALADEAAGARDHRAAEDHVEPRHLRAPRASGRPHQAALRPSRDRFSRVGPADDLRREGRPPNPRQGVAAARPHQARLRSV